EKNLKVSKIDALFDQTIMLVIGTSYLLAIIFGAQMVLSDEITLGQLITFTTYLGMMVWQLLALGMFFNLVQSRRASYERIEEIINTENDIGHDYLIEDAPDGDISLNIGAFKSPGDDEVALSDVNFDIIKGQTVG